MKHLLYFLLAFYWLLHGIIAYASANIPILHSSHDTPEHLFPAATGKGPYQITIDYTDAASRNHIKHTCLRLQGSGKQQTLIYLEMNFMVQLGGEGDHLENIIGSKVEIPNGYRVTYAFDINADWPSAEHIYFEAWSLDSSGQKGPVLSHEWHRSFNHQSILSDTRDFREHASISNTRVEPVAEEVQREVGLGQMLWTVRAGPAQDAGSHAWSDSADAVWADYEGLHLTIGRDSAGWYGSEIRARHRLGYGVYSFKLVGRIDELDPNVVLGLSVFGEDEEDFNIAFSRWGNPAADNAQFVPHSDTAVTQPDRFGFTQSGTYTLHVITWEPDRLMFNSYHGHQVNQQNMIHKKVYTGEQVPTLENENVRMCLKLVDTAPLDGQSVEFIIKDFTYVPFSNNMDFVTY